MPDQAAGLRSLFARRRPSLMIVAGSDAAKAAVALHFAREAAAGNRATVLIDGTAGQIAMACDVPGRYELAHVLAGDVPFRDVVRALTPHLLLLPAARALSRFGSFDAEEEARLAESFSSGIAQALTDAGTQTQVDLIVVNADEGQASRAVDAFGRDAQVIIVASDQGASLRGAYAEMKALTQLQGLEIFEIVVPRFGDDAPTGVAFANLSATARRFLDIELVDGGAIP
jgi:MinD-like ATPase involved in chromosome partitioning or flagellar assembly